MSDTVLVAVIGAFATVMTALFQIFVSSKQAASAVKPMRNRIKSLAWTGVLLVAAAGGGFAWSEYLVLNRNENLAAFHERFAISGAPVAGKAASMSVTPAPLPLAAPALTAAEAASRDAVAAVVTLPACRGGEGGCTQAAAAPVSLCVPLHTPARVVEVLLYARPENSTLPWNEHRMVPGVDVGAGRFVDAHFERTDGAGARDLCQKFAHWNPDTARVVRVVVRYALPGPATDAPRMMDASPAAPVEKPAG
jgi:hypothetical protein